MNWWEAPEWEERKPMDFGKPQEGPFERVALTTNPELYRTKHGQTRLRLVNRHPHEAVRIFCGRGVRC